MAKKDCCHQEKQRSEEEIKSLVTRLNRIEGQVRGVKNMVVDERYCVDILRQVSAIQAALNSFNKEMLASHIRTCVVEDVRIGKDEVIDELCDVIQKMMK